MVYKEVLDWPPKTCQNVGMEGLSNVNIGWNCILPLLLTSRVEDLGLWKILLTRGGPNYFFFLKIIIAALLILEQKIWKLNT